MTLSRRSFFIALSVIFVAAFALRMGLAMKFVGLNAPPDFSANPDQMDYELFAHRVSIGAGFTFEDGSPTARRSPGTSWALAPVYAIAGRSFAAGRVWFCLLSAATCLAVAWIASQLAGRGASLCAAALLAVYPGHAYYAMHFVSEVPYGLFLALGVGATIAALRNESRSSTILAGVCFGFAILCRTQLTLLVPIAVVALVLALRQLPRPQWWMHARQFALQVIVIAAVLAPWLIRNTIVFGKPVLTNIAGLGIWGAHNALTFNEAQWRGTWIKTSELERQFGALPADEVLKDEEARRRGMESIAVNLPRLPQIIHYKLGRLIWPFLDTPNKLARWSFAIAWLAVIPLVSIGTWSSWRSARQGTVLLLLPVFATIATVVLFYGSVRFRDSMAPLFITLAGIGAAQAMARVARALGSHDTAAPQPFALTAESIERKAA